ncbi:shikimate dehydrogenase [Marinobacter sp. LV10MA510-1]|uniref:shikimate dehydrogenase n=1 Tax=Marinobacter sp. LV10MA510-1 TaxID=1415567 RepID=UPI000BF523A6|nr:shikimate dehydrogenase [Marinobacter sp. LV10MA510-1]PFG10537.1 shikimate dehydrogenase [Marinobacter sp. LV10MA510-1]
MNNDLYAVIGHPISHSKSPRIHNLFASQTGEALEYTAIQAPLDGFENTVTEFFARGGKGLNVTVPFKEAAWQMAGRHSARALKAGAANTLYQDNGVLVADNTDGAGLVQDLLHNHQVALKGARILILGAGGAVRGVLAPLLLEQPHTLVIANRTPAKAQNLVSLFAGVAGITLLDSKAFDSIAGEFDVIINGTSASLQGDLPPLSKTLIGADTVIYDMMYAASNTTFNQWALDNGAKRVYDGLGMLVEQAAEAFEVWRGVRPQTAPVIAGLRTLN